VAEDPQQVVQRAVKAADQVQSKLHEVSRSLLEVQRYLRDERGHNRAVYELRQAGGLLARLGASSLLWIGSCVGLRTRSVGGVRGSSASSLVPPAGPALNP
jgi:hypothetical protein